MSPPIRPYHQAEVILRRAEEIGFPNLWSESEIEFMHDHWPDMDYRTIGGRNGSADASIAVRDGIVLGQTCPGKIEMVSDNRFNISGFGIGFLWNDLKCEAQEKAL